jgi:hypothetical protein
VLFSPILSNPFRTGKFWKFLNFSHALYRAHSSPFTFGTVKGFPLLAIVLHVRRVDVIELAGLEVLNRLDAINHATRETVWVSVNCHGCEFVGVNVT